jgi:hypothetical protein
MPLVGSGQLGPGQVAYYNIVLRANVTYRVYVRPNRSGVDFDLRIYDENGNLVQWDEDPASDAECFITPRWTGPFRVEVIAAFGGSGYGIIVEP